MIVLIDGPSGAGKSTLADRAAEEWRASGHAVALVRMDDIYPGWHGLRAASDHVERYLVEPLSRRRPGRWRSWNWDEDTAGLWHTVAPGGVLILEGCGTLSRANAGRADLRVWIDADDVIRRERAIGRDGDLFAPWWDVWDRQFDQFVARENPRALADLILDGTPPDAGRLTLPFPGYGGVMTTPHAETHYRVEYLDGPLAGQSEDRLLVHGEYDRQFTTIAAVNGLESEFIYVAVDSRVINGQLHVHYSFDAKDSDPVTPDQNNNGENISF